MKVPEPTVVNQQNVPNPGDNNDTDLIANETAFAALSSFPASHEMNGNASCDDHIYVNGNGSSMTSSDAASNQSLSLQGSPRISPVDQTTLKAQLKRQVEYYFSRENLNHDKYLVSQMDHDQYVQISIIANFNQVKKLTSDINLLVEVLRESNNVQVNEEGTKVRPLHKRCVIILREIPEGTEQQEIEEIFTHSDCPKFELVEQASDTFWYVHFETEEQAQAAFHFINNTLKTFKGQRIMARIKAKPTPVSSSRPEQRPVDTVFYNPTDPRNPAVPAALRFQMPVAPMPLSHIPFAFAPYMPPYFVHPLGPEFLINPGYPYDLSQLYGVPNHSSRGGGQHNGGRTHHGERRNHNRTHSATSDHSDAGSNSQSAATSNSSNTRSHNSYNGNYHQGRGGYSNRHGGEKTATRSKSYGGSVSTNEHYHVDIPPRHRDAAASGYRAHKRQAAAQNNTGNNSAQHNSSSSSSQHHSNHHHSNHQNHHSHQANHHQQPPPHHQSTSHQQQNTGNQLPRRNHSNPVSSSSNSNNRSMNSSTVGQVTGQQCNGVADSSSHSNDQQIIAGSKQAANTATHEYNRTSSSHHHGNKTAIRSSNNGGDSEQVTTRSSKQAHLNAQRKSKSPEKEVEITVIQPESFELDSSAFPALPGANTNDIPSTAISSAPKVAEHTSETKGEDANNCIKPTAVDTAVAKSTTDTPPKLSDIVKSKIPETTMSDIVKGVNRLHAPSTNNNNKDNVLTANTISTNAQSNQTKTTAKPLDRQRPNQLPNGSITEGPRNNTQAAQPSNKQVRSSPTSQKQPYSNTPISHAQAARPKSSTKTEAAKSPKSPEGDYAAEKKTLENAESGSAVSSPTESKISYAAMAQRIAPSTPTGANTNLKQEATPSTANDTNNNADHSKSSTTAKNDNLSSSTSSKNPPAGNVQKKGQNAQSQQNQPQSQQNNISKPSNKPSRPNNTNSGNNRNSASQNQTNSSQQQSATQSSAAS